MKCDRCGKEVKGLEVPGVATAGLYRLIGTCWEEFKRHRGENLICDECMFTDPKYIAIYGKD